MATHNDSRWSRRTYLKSIGVASGVALAGCNGQNSGGTETSTGAAGGGTASSGEWPNLSGTEVQVVIDETAEPVQNFYTGVMDDFNAATNANGEIDFVGKDQGGVQRVTQLIQAGDPPELFAMNQNTASSFENEGALAPITDVAEEVMGRLGESPKRIRWDGEEWLLPTFVNPAGWYWRGDLAEEVGMDRRPDWTWDLALEYAEKVDELDGIHGTFIPASSDVITTYNLRCWLRSNEGLLADWEDDQMAVAFDEGEHRDRMLEALNHLQESYQYAPVASDASWTEWERYIPDEVSACGVYTGYRPKMYSVQEEKAFAEDVHVSPMPENTTRNTGGNLDGLGVFEGSNVEAAKTFLRFLTQPEQLIGIYQINPVHDVPVYPEIRDGDEYQNFLAELPDAYTPEDTRTYQEDVVEQNVNSIEGTDPPNPYAGVITSDNTIPNLVNDVLVNDANPDDVIDQYAQELQSVLENAQN